MKLEKPRHNKRLMARTKYQKQYQGRCLHSTTIPKIPSDLRAVSLKVLDNIKAHAVPSL